MVQTGERSFHLRRGFGGQVATNALAFAKASARRQDDIMKILVTGFEPWGDLGSNPSGDVVRSLEGEAVDGADVLTAILPVEYGEDTEVVFPLIESHQPDAVLSFGLSRRPDLNVERVALNLKMDETPIVEGGPDAYLSTLPTKAMCDAIQAGGLPVTMSYHAGRFLCNHVMYCVLHHLKTSGLSIPAGFIHVPPTPELIAAQGNGGTGLEIEKTREGAVLAIRNLVGFLGNS
jgi:pyroglutamyl-peptidase